MPLSERWARQLFRELPKDPEDLLLPGGRNYADPGFLALFFGWLDQLIYEDPQAGLPWARVALRLTLTANASPEDRVRAFASLGAAYRAIGCHDDSETQIEMALGIAQSRSSVLFRKR